MRDRINPIRRTRRKALLPEAPTERITLFLTESYLLAGFRKRLRTLRVAIERFSTPRPVTALLKYGSSQTSRNSSRMEGNIFGRWFRVQESVHGNMTRKAPKNWSLGVRSSMTFRYGNMPSTSNFGPPNHVKIKPPINPPRCPQLSIPGERPIIKFITATVITFCNARLALLPSIFWFW